MQTLHQLVSNLRAIAEPFVFPTPKSSQVVVFYEFMKGGEI